MVFSPEGVRHLWRRWGRAKWCTAQTCRSYGRPRWTQILEEGIPDAQKEAILGGNLVKSLRL
jgi:hypothetical protein